MTQVRSVEQGVPHPGVQLRARDVSFAYGSTQVLRQVSLDVQPGESVAIMGASGSGKSTLLQILGGILTPESGEVLLGDRRFSQLSPGRRDAVRLSTFGFVFQFGELLPELTLVENVELPLLLLGEQRRRAHARARATLDEVGVGDLSHHRITEVSGGQEQRAAIARALVHSPCFILADEPTGSLDREATDLVLRLMLDTAARRSTAVVLVTHAESVAGRCDRTLTLCAGHLE